MAKTDGSARGTVLVFGVVTVAAALLVSTAYEWSRERIAAHERAALVARLNSVLEPTLRGRDLTTTRVTVTDEALLGSATPADAFVVMDGPAPVAAVLSAVAPHGYNSSIQMLVGIAPDGTVTGVRVVRHRETAGLGDAIDSAKSDWITQFSGRSLMQPEQPHWALRRDDGAFDAITGATVTSRAVVTAVKNALLYFEQHRDELVTLAATNTDDPDP